MSGAFNQNVFVELLYLENFKKYKNYDFKLK